MKITETNGDNILRICSQVSGHVFRHFEPMETAGEDGDECYLNESDEACVRPVEDRVQPAIAAEPSEGPLDDPSDFAWNEFSFDATHPCHLSVGWKAVDVAKRYVIQGFRLWWNRNVPRGQY